MPRSSPLPSEITPATAFLSRRAWLGGALALPWAGRVRATGAAAGDLTPNTYEQITRHNNYYEFTTAKDVVWKLAEEFRTEPWTLAVEGEVLRPRTWGVAELLAHFAQEDRVYRLRCVEGWSMVVPWRGFALAALLAEAHPTSRARFVEFVGVRRPAEMIGQRQGVLDWPYREALRLDEAMHPLSLMVTGLYGKPLPAQNGAPLRLAVPWKYGFKSIKAITRIRLVEAQPLTAWVKASPSEYGFYGNVNPDVPHPRWSQKREVRIGSTAKRPTLPFNGYAAEVAHLYAGMDLARHF